MTTRSNVAKKKSLASRADVEAVFHVPNQNAGFIIGCVVLGAVLVVYQILECRNLHCRRGNLILPRWLC